MRRRDLITAGLVVGLLNVANVARAARPQRHTDIFTRPTHRIVLPPTLFTNPVSGQQWTPPATIYRDSLGRLYTMFDVRSLIPSVTKTYYVDPVSGSDSNGGTTRAAALKNLSTALAKTDVDQIIIINLAVDFIARGTAGWNNVQPSRSLSVINESGMLARFISCRTASAVGLTWTVNTTYSNVYQAASTTAGAAQAIDFKYNAPIINRQTGAALPKAYKPEIHVASIAAVAATPGSWYCDNTNVYVRLRDDRTAISDPSIQITSASNNGRFPASTNNITIYVQDIDFVGGTSPFLAGMSASSIAGCTFVHNRCTFQCSSYASSNGPNGLSTIGNMLMIGYRSGCYYNSADGFNDHSVESDGTTLNTSSRSFLNECVSLGNGETGSTGTSDNAYTAHDDCRTACLNCIANDSDDGLFAYTNFSRAWLLGCYAGPALQTSAGSNYSVGALISAQVWIDTMVFGTPSSGGANAQVAATTGKINYANMAAPTVGSSANSPGPVVAYAA